MLELKACHSGCKAGDKPRHCVNNDIFDDINVYGNVNVSIN